MPVPYREIVGCLLWIVLCVVGTELLRVKDLARRSNNPTTDDYFLALKALKRIAKRQDAVIIYKRSSAGCEMIPSQTRPDATIPSSLSSTQPQLIPEHIEKLLWYIGRVRPRFLHGCDHRNLCHMLGEVEEGPPFLLVRKQLTDFVF
jgi:hypothetical protein